MTTMLYKLVHYLASFTAILTVCTLCTLGCNRIDERILKSSEDMLRGNIKHTKKYYPREGNDWLYEYSMPGEVRGLKVLKKVRRERREVTAMMSAGLPLVRDSRGRYGHTTVYFIHPPGYTIIDGIYFVTPDGKKHDFRVVLDHDHINRATWLRAMTFIVAIDDCPLDKKDREFLKERSMKPICLSGEMVDTGELEVGLIMPGGQYSDTVPVCIEYKRTEKRDKNKSTSDGIDSTVE